jgi:intraflagellar transport protein 81
MSKRLEPQRAQLNSTTMIQDIVAILKNPPFNETMTLFSFEEKKEYELLDLIIKVMGMIDTSVKLDNNDTAACLKAIFEFLLILKFPYPSERQLQDDLAHGDKRLLIQILHFLLTGLRTLSDKYYVNKFTSPININQEYLGDEDISELYNQLKELQAEFLTTYNMLQEKKQNAPRIEEIQEDIRKSQNDKLQLSRSIAKLKKEYTSKPDFPALFEMTSKLRKEQEQDSNLEKKIAKQMYDIKEAEERLIVAQQRLIDNKKNLDNNVSALKLLENARAQRNNNRDAFENLSKYELIDRRNRIKTMEEIIQMPEISMSDLQELKQQRQDLLLEIDKLENKLKNSPTHSSELQIYKQSAMQATNAREASEKNLAKLEKEKNLLEIKYNELNKKFEAQKGYKFVRKNDLIQQAENLKKKKEIYHKCQKVIDKIKGEALILDRTINILKEKTPDGEDILKKYEEKNGKILNQAKRELEQLATRKQEIDESKALTLEEYAKLIQQLKKKIADQDKRNIIAPLAEERDKLKKEYEMILPTYEKKKRDFQNATADLRRNYDSIEAEYNESEKTFRECQNKYHQLNLSNLINAALLKRCEDESQYMSKQDKRYRDDFKDYQSYYKELINQEASLIRELREKQLKTKEAFEDNDRQTKMYSDMKALLTVKLESITKK